MKHFMKSDSSNELKYTQTKLFHFDRNLTAANLTEKDTICTINLALVVSMTHCTTLYHIVHCT